MDTERYVYPDEAKVEALAVQARELMNAVEAHRAAGRRLLDRIIEVDRELGIAVPEDDEDTRFDCAPWQDGMASIMAAASGLETGLEVPEELSGYEGEWHQLDRWHDRFVAGATKPSEV